MTFCSNNGRSRVVYDGALDNGYVDKETAPMLLSDQHATHGHSCSAPAAQADNLLCTWIIKIDDTLTLSRASNCHIALQPGVINILL